MIQVYGIPNCGTCQKALKGLDTHQIPYEFINLKETPPNRDLIQNWVKYLTAKAMRNTSGRSYRELGEDKNQWTEQQWIEAFSQDAMLIKRPIIVKDQIPILVGFRLKEDELMQKLK